MRYVVAELSSWRITHDASGKVLVRRFVKGDEVLLATARWRDNMTVDRMQTDPKFPGDERWAEIDQAVRVALEAAKDMGPDPRLDPAELPPRKAEKAKVKPIGNVGLVLVVLFLGVVAFGLYKTRDYWLWIVKDSGDFANGDTCKRDGDCRSGNCYKPPPGVNSRRTCVPNERKRGDRCEKSSECSSGSCDQHVCN